LVVDDSESLLELCRMALQDEGYEVLTASIRQEAMKVLQQSLVNAVVMDMRMPDMDCVEALEKIVTRRKKTPIIIHTAYPAYREHSLVRTAEAYVVKTSEFAEIKETLHRVLVKSQ
jgi:two-component system response regulator AtoC